ncbi:hypothetical protein [Dokdonella sp.]|uniref:hypothetical protein n=1 Tax=Dokdonella sp. TaxID=2291710 RepID=UPI0025C34F80|nr:hypothetical protein [Dokdonella sp.]MBX3689090.1 hypothetical protein [Dokdonella sp.]
MLHVSKALPIWTTLPLSLAVNLCVSWAIALAGSRQASKSSRTKARRKPARPISVRASFGVEINDMVEPQIRKLVMRETGPLDSGFADTTKAVTRRSP